MTAILELTPSGLYFAIEKMNQCYRDVGINLPETRYIGEIEKSDLPKDALVISPPSADNPAWMRRFPERSRAFASGWMRIHGTRMIFCTTVRGKDGEGDEIESEGKKRSTVRHE